MNQKQLAALEIFSTETNYNTVKSRTKPLGFTLDEYDALVLFIGTSQKEHLKKQGELAEYISSKKEELEAAKSIKSISESAERVSVIKMHIEEATNRLNESFKETEVLDRQSGNSHHIYTVIIETIQAKLYEKLKKEYAAELQKLTGLRNMLYTVSYGYMPAIGGFNEFSNNLQGSLESVQIDYRAAEKELK